MPSSVDSSESLPPLKNDVIRLCCLGAIVSTAIGFYGGLLIPHEVTWLFMLIMIVGNAASVYVSMKYGYDTTGAVAGGGVECEQPPAIMVTADDDERERLEVESVVAVKDSVDGQETFSVTQASYVAAPLETHL